MGKVKYYDYEIEDRLRQVDINRNDIGMTQINALPLPEGVWDDSQVDIPDTMELTTEGDKSTGTVTVSVSGTAPDTENLPVGIYSFKLSPTGRGTGAIGIIKPGKYLLSLGGSASVADMPWQLPGTTWYPEIYANVIKPDGTFESYHVKCFDDPVEVVIPEDVAEVEIQLYLYFDYFTNVTASCELYPFLRLKAFEDEPFEPYKPSLYEQVNNFTARLTDTLGTDGSINLFPIDKGTPSEPVTVELTGGTFYIQKGNSLQSPWIGFEGTSDNSNREEYRTYFNCGYRFEDDNPWLFGDLVPDDYVLSFDVVIDTGFTDVADIKLEVYESAAPPTSSYGDLIETCTGDDAEFTVTAAKPYITIVAAVELRSGEDWTGKSISVTPFLRRKMFASASYDRYKPSIAKQLAEIRDKLANMGGYNETRTDYISDNVEEVI